LRKPLPPLSSVHTVVFDFDGVFTDNKVWVDQDGRESVRCDRGDGLAFDLVRAYQRHGKMKATMFILSKEFNPVVLARASKLKLDCQHGIGDKLTFLQGNFAQRFPGHNDPFAGLIYLGNDINDLPVMRRAGFAVAPADAHPLVQEIAHLVLPQRGGDGFVRAFIEQWLGINQLSKEKLDELVFDR
jgi:YrbI family 3-deoxy-D-manno-octulosonate 8-phosphate phosphatase